MVLPRELIWTDSLAVGVILVITRLLVYVGALVGHLSILGSLMPGVVFMALGAMLVRQVIRLRPREGAPNPEPNVRVVPSFDTAKDLAKRGRFDSDDLAQTFQCNPPRKIEVSSFYCDCYYSLFSLSESNVLVKR